MTMRAKKRKGAGEGAVASRVGSSSSSSSSSSDISGCSDGGRGTLKLLLVAFALAFFKLAFVPTYRSTDFEVHRNWLAITWELPISKWYTEATSQWTLDYPPFFAWFEFGLAHVAQHFDAAMLHVKNLNYASENTILFQRLSVIAADTLLVLGVLVTKKPGGGGWSRARFAGQLAVLLSFGLLLVDHIHFQYNGFLFGILLLALAGMVQGHQVVGAIAFAALLNCKHIYIYIAPAVFVFLLRQYCFRNTLSFRSLSVGRFLQLGLAVIAVFALSFGPFIYLGQLPQVLSRLFPFKRGLCHAYWAANAWALYNALDKTLFIAGRKLDLLNLTSHSTASFTGGLVTDEQSHAVLPDVLPIATFAVTFLAMLPCLVSLLARRTTASRLYEAVTLCALASFLFGWHVHEKAILMGLIPLSVVAFTHPTLGKGHLLLQAAGGYALFPLVFTTQEEVIKTTMFVAYIGLLGYLHFGYADSATRPSFNTLEQLYCWGILPLHAYTVAHPFVLGDRLPFLPLMATSVYCALGVTYAFVLLYIHFLRGLDTNVPVKKQQ